MTPARPAGWHPDETDAALLRYWDGSGWTPHTSALAVAEDDAPHRTVRLPDATSDHTTVPTPPAHRAGAATVRVGALSIAGAVAGGAALVVACAALAVALLR